jgi:hypothetical protein
MLSVQYNQIYPLHFKIQCFGGKWFASSELPKLPKLTVMCASFTAFKVEVFCVNSVQRPKCEIKVCERNDVRFHFEGSKQWKCVKCKFSAAVEIIEDWRHIALQMACIVLHEVVLIVSRSAT